MRIFGTSVKGDITINGRRVSNISGRNIEINDDQILVDGKPLDEDIHSARTIHLTLTGDVEKIETGSGDVEVHGNVGRIKTTSGDVSCGDVSGSISSVSGDVDCDDVEGGVSTTSGDIHAKQVEGDASSMSGKVSCK